VTQPAATSLEPRIDLEGLLIVHQGNLAVANEAQYLLAEAVRSVLRVQYRCVERWLADAWTTLAAPPLLQPQATAAVTRAALDRTASAAGEVVDLTCDAQRRVRELLALRLRSNLDAFVAQPAHATDRPAASPSGIGARWR
jgi:hypothetical protein